MRRLLACVYLVVAYSVLAAAVPTIFLTRARNTGELEFYGLWFAAEVVFALMGGMACAGVYAKERPLISVCKTQTGDDDERASAHF